MVIALPKLGLPGVKSSARMTGTNLSVRVRISSTLSSSLRRCSYLGRFLLVGIAFDNKGSSISGVNDTGDLACR